jgi:AcrR family transcriptional regulator
LAPDQETVKTDPRILRTRKLIDEAFLSVLNDKGFEELSVQDVADRAGINRATFYAHYGDKYDLMADWIRKDFTEKLQEKDLLVRDLSETSVQEIITLVCAYVAGLHGHCKPPHRHLDWMLEQEITGYCAELFRTWMRGQRNSSGRKSIQTRSTAAAGAMYALVLDWLLAEKRPSVEAFAKSILPTVTRILLEE